MINEYFFYFETAFRIIIDKLLLIVCSQRFRCSRWFLNYHAMLATVTSLQTRRWSGKTSARIAKHLAKLFAAELTAINGVTDVRLLVQVF